jgi:hypothetical protein
MISFVKSADPHPLDKKVEDNRFEQLRKAAAERHRKSDTDGTRRRARQTAEDNRLIWGAYLLLERPATPWDISTE